ncbi:MAG TPA: SH3 domain-containing protein [Pyrinomonadaceae bacterium]|jgi:uncharacterized protein YgiM (DUF1202 family)
MNIKIYSLTVLMIAAFVGVALMTRAEATTCAANLVQADDPCKVSDPTGTVLNVRSKPNGGKIVRRLKNGTKVFIVYETGDEQDRAWSKISLSNKGNAPVIGWVLREYLDCP